MIKQLASPGFLVFSYAIFFYFHGIQGILWVIIATLCVGILLFYKQDKLVYMTAAPSMPQYPNENTFGLRHPSEIGLNSRDIEIRTDDEVTLRGWYIQSDLETSLQRLVIYFQDNAGSTFDFTLDIGLKLPFIRNMVQRTNSNLIIVAYRGYSNSEGIPSESGLKKDSRAILNFAVNIMKKQNIKGGIYIYGRSLGGAVAIDVCSQPQIGIQVDGILLQNTFKSLSGILYSLLPILKPLKFLQKNHWRSIDIISKIKQPIYFIKSMKDEIVDVSHMHKLQSCAISSMLIDELQMMTGTHNSTWQQNPDQFFAHILTFFHRVAQSKRQRKI